MIYLPRQPAAAVLLQAQVRIPSRYSRVEKEANEKSQVPGGQLALDADRYASCFSKSLLMSGHSSPWETTNMIAEGKENIFSSDLH
jgi:hypothetical protein